MSKVNLIYPIWLCSDAFAVTVAFMQIRRIAVNLRCSYSSATWAILRDGRNVYVFRCFLFPDSANLTVNILISFLP